MIKYVNVYDFDTIENFLFQHPDKEYKTRSYTYWLAVIGDCSGIFRRLNKTPNKEPNKEPELCVYYHEGEF